MKVFFTASQRGKKDNLKYYKEIAATVTKLGYTLLDDDLLKMDTAKFYEYLDTGKKDAYTKFYEEKMRHLQEADIVLFDVSTDSMSIGFIINKSLEYNKPTIVLYHKDDPPVFLSGSTEDKLILQSYDDNNIAATVEEVLTQARERRDKRFNFFISENLLEYLEEASKKEGLTKSRFIRNLIQEHRKASK